ncbi:MAG TPA: TetR family transcriptional regulator, partial [Rhodobacteraceae bacterium]|nr:TetR family transcriptional regulator [Paracoccaceae bacterium]
ETLIAYQAADHQHRIQIRRFGVIPRDQQKVLPVYQRDLIKQLSDIVLAILPDIFINDAAKLR